MAVIRCVVCIRKIWRLGHTLNYLNILQPIHSNVFCSVTHYMIQSGYFQYLFSEFI